MTKTLDELLKIIEKQNNIIKNITLKVIEQESLIEELLR